MTVTPTSFRSDFPEFATASDGSVNFWLGVGALLILSCPWGALQDFGTELFIAHNLALEQIAQRAAANGGTPGLNFGVTSGKTVDKLSITYDAEAGVVKDAGHWNLTTYGTRFIQLADLAGAGGYQAGAGPAPYTLGNVAVFGGAFGVGWPYI